MKKKEIVSVLEEIAVLLELKGENPFKIRAYQNGARALDQLEEPLEVLIQEDRVGEIDGLGKALVDKVTTLAKEGKLEYYEKLRDSIPEGLLEMIEIPGLGGKRIKKIHDALGVESIDELEKASADGRIAGLSGFGDKTAQNILNNIRNMRAYSARHLWWKADQRAVPILEGLRKLECIQRAEGAGSLRRFKETVGDLDFIVASDDPDSVMDWFVKQPGIQEVTARGDTKCSVRFEDGLQADLRVVPDRQFPFALHHFTGSKDHNVKMRQRAIARGYSLSEWGLKALSSEEKKKASVEIEADPQKVASEEDLFACLGLPWIRPELREGLDEITLAEDGKLPDELPDDALRGVFHNHTTASDGSNSLDEMAQAAEDLGWDYLGIADHSKASFQANGLNEEQVEKQILQIRKLNESGKFKIHVFAGIECDILGEGQLDLDEGILSQLDYVVASVHSSLGQSEDKMTQRLIRALESPYVTMLGHPTGRLLLKREESKVDLNKVIDAASANGKMIELNCNPYRLDLDWRYWRRAASKGVLCSINPDAHDTAHYEFTKLGIGIARKGGLGPKDIFNTRPLAEVRKLLKRGR